MRKQLEHIISERANIFLMPSRVYFIYTHLKPVHISVKTQDTRSSLFGIINIIVLFRNTITSVCLLIFYFSDRTFWGTTQKCHQK